MPYYEEALAAAEQMRDEGKKAESAKQHASALWRYIKDQDRFEIESADGQEDIASLIFNEDYARLMAAAPELLEALESAQKFDEELAGKVAAAAHAFEELKQKDAWQKLGEWLYEQHFNGVGAGYRDELSAAITKATGGAS